MGRAIDQDNRLDNHERRLKLVEDALEELVQTRVHHVDLHEESIRKENSIVEPDKEFTPSTSKRKKITKPIKVESLL